MTIQSLPWLKFGHNDYLVSEFRGKANVIAKAAYFELLCFAMKQTPALSIPNDDSTLAGWIGFSKAKWLKIKELVLSQFTFSPSENRYYSPMLVKLYDDSESPKQETTQPKTKSTAQTSTERVRNHRAKQAQLRQETTETETPANADCNVGCNPTCNEATLRNVACNDEETACNVTAGGIKWGELKADIELNQKPTTTVRSRFCLTFDFQPQANAVQLLMDKLTVEAGKNTRQNLNNFIGHYQAKAISNTQAEWEWLYVKWLKRENAAPTAKTSVPVSKGKAPVPPVRLADDRPTWMIFAERNAAKKAALAARQG